MGKKIVIGLLIFTAFAFYGIAMAIAGITLVSMWIPWTICGSLALISGITLWRLWIKLTDSSRFIVNYICHVVWACGFFLFVFFFSNEMFADRDTIHVEKVEVVRKYTEQRYRSKRVGTRRYVRGEPYKVYFIEVKFPDGRLKARELPLKEFNLRRKGEILDYNVEMGLFHMPIIKRN